MRRVAYNLAVTLSSSLSESFSSFSSSRHCLIEGVVVGGGVKGFEEREKFVLKVKGRGRGAERGKKSESPARVAVFIVLIRSRDYFSTCAFTQLFSTSIAFASQKSQKSLSAFSGQVSSTQI